jgi:hypothetical protein
MSDFTKLPGPLRQLVADWLARIVERLFQLQDQLRYSLIRMISSSVAETIEDQLHRPFGTSPDSYEEEYQEYESTTSAPRLAYSPESESTPSPASERWHTAFSDASQFVRRWFQKPWVETVLAGGVTLMSLFFLVG